MNEVDSTREKQKRLRGEYKTLYEKVADILNRHDPIGLNVGEQRDEYEPEVGTILPRLKEARSEEELRRIIHEEFVRWFGTETAGPAPRYGSTASDIWKFWNLPPRSR